MWLCREVGSFKLPFQEEATAWGDDGGSRKDLLCPCRSSYSAVPSGLAYFLLEVRGGSGRFSLHSEYEQQRAVFAWWWAALGDSPWQEGGLEICVSPCCSMTRGLRRVLEKVGEVAEASPLPGICRFLL